MSHSLSIVPNTNSPQNYETKIMLLQIEWDLSHVVMKENKVEYANKPTK
jgi:hypothetical protein